MRASELHNLLAGRVDDLQKKVKNSARDQVQQCLQLDHEQTMLKNTMEIIINDGDRELTGHEVVFLRGEI